MQHRTKLQRRAAGFAIAAALTLASSASHAACTTIGTTGTVGFNLAVASNFYLSAQSIAAGFLAVGPKGYDISICEGSSDALFNAITSTNNSAQYALFMSADQARPDALRRDYGYLTLAAPFPYAKGTPVFLLSPNAYSATAGTYKAANYLLTRQASGATATRSDSSLPTIANQVRLNKTAPAAVTTLAVGDPAAAPYGLQAARLLGSDAPNYPHNMNQWVAPVAKGTSTTTACTSAICSYGNINLTLDAINNNAVTAGFVSYGQVCPALTGTSYALDRYVLFTEYPIVQSAIQLDVTNNAAETRAADFKAYMLGGAGSASWNAWLTSHCYQAL